MAGAGWSQRKQSTVQAGAEGSVFRVAAVNVVKLAFVSEGRWTGFAGVLHVMSKVTCLHSFWPEQLEGRTCHLLRWEKRERSVFDHSGSRMIPN